MNRALTSCLSCDHCAPDGWDPGGRRRRRPRVGEPRTGDVSALGREVAVGRRLSRRLHGVVRRPLRVSRQARALVRRDPAVRPGRVAVERSRQRPGPVALLWGRCRRARLCECHTDDARRNRRVADGARARPRVAAPPRHRVRVHDRARQARDLPGTYAVDHPRRPRGIANRSGLRRARRDRREPGRIALGSAGARQEPRAPLLLLTDTHWNDRGAQSPTSGSSRRCVRRCRPHPRRGRARTSKPPKSRFPAKIRLA